MTDFTLPSRHVHLDFHTSPFIPDVCCEFDGKMFADTFRKAHVESVAIFAKCHHGMCYYPTTTGTAHPALRGRDLLGEQIEALHRAGIRCPIYTTVVWEEDVAQKHPEWRQLDKTGRFAGWTTSANQKDTQPGIWKFNNFLDPDYQDYMEAHVRELFARYGEAIDGMFFDILFFAPGACWTPASVAFREKHGLVGDDAGTFQRFEGLAQAAFTEKFSRIVRGLSKRASIFYNAGNDLSMDATIGPRARAPHMSHFEIESLPSGFWGYYHFPRLARCISRWGKPWLAQTGRFQKMWGDFGGIKPQAALEFECFRTQALGGCNLVGDQLPPRGTPDATAYELIGAVYAQCAAADAFYAGSQALPQVGVFTAHWPGFDGAASGKSEEAAVGLCEEFHYDAAVLDAVPGELDTFDVLILPDTTVITPEVRAMLASYYAGGGKLVLSHRAGFGPDGKFVLDFLPLTFHGDGEKFPTYWRATDEMRGVLGTSDRVFYQAGVNVTGGHGTRVLSERVLPYFNRTDIRFCSHFQTPPVAGADVFPAIIAGGRFVYFADPIFREYRQSGNPAVRLAWRQAMESLTGPAPFGAGLPSTMLTVPRRRGRDLILTLLHYVPVRKSLDIDIIDERMGFAAKILQLPSAAKRVRVFGSGEELEQAEGGGFVLPATEGRLLLEVSEYFEAHRRR